MSYSGLGQTTWQRSGSVMIKDWMPRSVMRSSESRQRMMGSYVSAPAPYHLYSPDRSIPISRWRPVQGLGAVELGLLAIL